MLLIVHKCFLMTLPCKIIVFKPTLQSTNKLFFSVAKENNCSVRYVIREQLHEEI